MNLKCEVAAAFDLGKEFFRAVGKAFTPLPTLSSTAESQLRELLFHPELLKLGELRVSVPKENLLLRSYTISAMHPHEEMGRIVLRHRDYGIGSIAYVTSLDLFGADGTVRKICCFLNLPRVKTFDRDCKVHPYNGMVKNEPEFLLEILHREYLLNRARVNDPRDLQPKFQGKPSIAGPRGDLASS